MRSETVDVIHFKTNQSILNSQDAHIPLRKSLANDPHMLVTEGEDITINHNNHGTISSIHYDMTPAHNHNGANSIQKNKPDLNRSPSDRVFQDFIQQSESKGMALQGSASRHSRGQSRRQIEADLDDSEHDEHGDIFNDSIDKS